jgi:hypothetical protein
VVVYQPGDRLKEGTQIFSLLSVQQKVFKKWGSTYSQQRQLTTVCWCCFSLKFLICWWNRPTYTNSNT